jgi:hypothetical protein
MLRNLYSLKSREYGSRNMDTKEPVSSGLLHSGTTKARAEWGAGQRNVPSEAEVAIHPPIIHPSPSLLHHPALSPKHTHTHSESTTATTTKTHNGSWPLIVALASSPWEAH